MLGFSLVLVLVWGGGFNHEYVIPLTLWQVSAVLLEWIVKKDIIK